MRRRGSILVAVLMMASVLVVFVGVGVERLQVARSAVRAARDGFVADTLAAATVERLFARGGGRFDRIEGVVGFAFDGASVEATVRDEAGRVDLNLAPVPLLIGLMEAVGIDHARAVALGRTLEDRRRPLDDPGGSSARRRPLGGPLEHVAELASIPGFTAADVARLWPHVTVAGFSRRVAVTVADPVVVAALPGFDRARLQGFLAARRTIPASFETFVTDWGIDPDHVTKSGGSSWRLHLTVHVGPHRVRRYEIVVAVRQDDTEPYRILSWESDRPLDAKVP